MYGRYRYVNKQKYPILSVYVGYWIPIQLINMIIEAKIVKKNHKKVQE